MSKKPLTQILPPPSICVECRGRLPFAYYICKSCGKALCAKCREIHVKNKHGTQYPTLTAMGCIICGGPLDGGTCSYQSPPCMAPLCQNWECREKHEDRHYGSRSDEEKNKNPSK